MKIPVFLPRRRMLALLLTALAIPIPVCPAREPAPVTLRHSTATMTSPAGRAAEATREQAAQRAIAWLKHHGEATLTFDDEDIRKIVGAQLSGHLATDAGLARLEPLDSLRVLALWPDSAHRLTDRALRSAARMQDLEFLRAAPNRFTDRGLAQLKNSRNLRGLILEPARVSDAGLAQLRELCCLQALSLNGANIHDSGLSALEKLEHLEFLSLRRTRVTEAALPSLRGRIDDELMTLRGPYRLRVLALPSEIRWSDRGVVELIKTLGMTRLETIEPLETRNPQMRELIDSQRATITYWREERGAYVQLDEGAEGLEIAGLFFQPADSEQPLSLFGLPQTLRRLSLKDTYVNDDELVAELAGLNQLETLNLFNTGMTLEGADDPPGVAGPWRPGITDRGLDGLAQLGLPNLKTVILDDDENRISAEAVQRFEQATGARVIRRALADQPEPCCPQLEQQEEAPPQREAPGLIARRHETSP